MEAQNQGILEEEESFEVMQWNAPHPPILQIETASLQLGG